MQTPQDYTGPYHRPLLNRKTRATTLPRIWHAAARGNLIKLETGNENIVIYQTKRGKQWRLITTLRAALLHPVYQDRLFDW